MAEKVSTQDALKKLEAQLECSLCLDYFKEPKLLPCFHTFCKSPCLEKLVSRDGHSLTCPICRHVVQLSEKGIVGLQSDFNIARLFEVKEAFDKAKDSDEKHCENCEGDKATGYCNNCEELLCGECIAIHKRGKKYKIHTLLTLDQLKSQATKLLPPKKPLPNCTKHPENPLKIYCETCSELICYDCTIALHRDHKYNLVADLFPKHRQELVSSLKPVREKLHKVQEAIKAFDLRGKQIYEQRATFEADIHKEIDQLHRLLDQRRAVLLGELEELTQQNIKKLVAQRDQVEMTQAQLSSCLEYAEGGLETGTEVEVLAMKAPVMDRIQQISAEFNPDSLRPETEADLELVPHGKQELQQASQEFLQLVDSNSFSLENSKLELDGLKDAQVGQQKTVTFTAMNRRNKPIKCQLEIKAQLSNRDEKNFTKCEVTVQQNGKHRINYTPMRQGDKLHLTANGNPIPGSPFKIAVLPQRFQQPTRVIPGLTKPLGVAFNSKGHMIVIDCKGTTVSVLTPDGEKIRSFGSEGSGNGQFDYAHGVTVDKEDNIYVGDNDNHRVQKFNSHGIFIKKVGSKGSGNLQFSHPVGITYNHNDNLLYVADNSNHRIQVLTTDLTFERAFGKPGSGKGKFNHPYHVAFDSANNIYVTDCYNNRVQVLTTTGQFLRSFSEKSNGQKLIRPWAIAIDNSNSVYVSEGGSNYFVSVFSSQGDYITSVKHGITCWGLAIDNNDTLIVSAWNEGCLLLY